VLVISKKTARGESRVLRRAGLILGPISKQGEKDEGGHKVPFGGTSSGIRRHGK